MRFDDIQAVSIAVEMERRGEEFYTKAARVSRNAEAVALLEKLAGEERCHMADFQKIAQRLCGDGGCAYDDETGAYLTAIAADIVFPGGLMELIPDGGLHSAEAVLRYAIRSEKDSILFYSEMTRHALDESARAVFEEILKAERGHLARLVIMLEKVLG